MKNHDWKYNEHDGGSMGMYEVFECADCGACGGLVDKLENLPGRAFYPNGSGLKLPDDCDTARLIVAAFELGTTRPDLGKNKPDKTRRKGLRAWLHRLSVESKKEKT